MIITETKLRQIIKQELLVLLEGKVPMEDLAIFYHLLQNLQRFTLPKEKEEETLSFFNNEMIINLDTLINKIINDDVDKELKKLNESISDTLNYYFGQEQNKKEIVKVSDLKLTIDKIIKKLKKLEKVIKNKRYMVGSKKYLRYHDNFIKPILVELIKKLKVVTQGNVRYPSSDTELELPKRTHLKHLKQGRQ